MAILQREYELWNDRLRRIRTANERMSAPEFADALARSLEERAVLLKIMAMNHYDMEENSRLERLVEFKKTYGRSLAEVRSCLDKFFPGMTSQDRQDFIFSFFPFMFGIYPYTVVTEKQKEAMKLAGVDYTYSSLYDLTFIAARSMLRN